MNKKYIFAGVLVIILAFFFRFYLLQEMPGGLFPDEAANGLDINLMEQGQLQAFYERGNGREALFFYMIWGFVKLLGRSPLSHHLTSATVGLLATLGCMLVTYALFKFSYRQKKVFNAENKIDTLTSDLQSTPSLSLGHARPIAILAGFLMATSAWHIVLSRTAFRANLIPLFTAFTFYFFLRITAAQTRARQYFWSLLAGGTFAAGFYTYIAYRIMVPIVAVLVLWPLIIDVFTKPRLQKARTYAPLLITSIIAFAVVIYPLANYFYTHPGSFVGRSGQVSIFNPELNGGNLPAALAEVTKQSLFGYAFEGDLNWRHNLSGFPFLSPIISPFFALGLLLVTLMAIRYFLRPVKHQEDFKYFLLAGWFWGMLLPVITTAEGIPHGLRAIGTIPAVFIITAWCMYHAWARAIYFVRSCYAFAKPWRIKAVEYALYGLVIAFIAALPLQTYALYFIGAYNSPENFYSFRSDLTTVSDYLKKHGNRSNTYLVLDKFSVQTVDYLTTIEGSSSCDRDQAYRPKDCIDNPKNKPYAQVDPEDSWKSAGDYKDGRLIWEHGLNRGDRVVFAQSSIFDIKKFKTHHPNSRLENEVRNKFGQAVLAVYQITAEESKTLDNRILLNHDNRTQYNKPNESSCAEGFVRDTATEQALFEDAEKGLRVQLPYNPKWGSNKFKISPFETLAAEHFDGELFVNRGRMEFGSIGIFEGCGWVRQYTLTFIDPLTPVQVKEKIAERKTQDLSSTPVQKIINGFTVIEWTSAGLCDYGHVLVIGKKYDYLFTPVCGVEFETFENIIKTMDLI